MNSRASSPRVAPPEREEAALAGGGEPLFAVGADILEEEVAEGDRLDAGQRLGTRTPAPCRAS